MQTLLSVPLERDEFSLLRRPDRSAKREVEGPSSHDKPHIVERRSLHYASLRSAPVGTTEQAIIMLYAPMSWRDGFRFITRSQRLARRPSGFSVKCGRSRRLILASIRVGRPDARAAASAFSKSC
jgi:hypothetical protein